MSNLPATTAFETKKTNKWHILERKYRLLHFAEILLAAKNSKLIMDISKCKTIKSQFRKIVLSQAWAETNFAKKYVRNYEGKIKQFTYDVDLDLENDIVHYYKLSSIDLKINFVISCCIYILHAIKVEVRFILSHVTRRNLDLP